MQSQEKIAAAIESHRKRESWAQERLGRLQKLRKPTRVLGQMLLGFVEDTPEKMNLQNRWQIMSRAAQGLRDLDEDELIAVGSALFPQFPTLFKNAWTLHERLPYLLGPTRKPFRAANRPDLLRESRVEFLSELVRGMEGLTEDLPWLAAHAAHLWQWSGGQQIGILLAAAIDAGGSTGEQIQNILKQSAESTHEVGQMGRHVTAAFLCSANSDCWDYVEKLLMAAQRQEGLRQAILESVDFSHPTAFRRMLRLISDNNLVRFSATVRAADVWFGFPLDSQSERYVQQKIETTANYLDDEDARAKALAGEDAPAAYLALWSIAFDDAPSAAESACKLLRHRQPEMRYAGLHLIRLLGLPESFNRVLPSVDDKDERVADLASEIADANLHLRMVLHNLRMVADDADSMAVPAWMYSFRIAKGEPPPDSGDLFERLVRLYQRLPEKEKVAQPLVWPWARHTLHRQDAADHMINALGTRPRATLLPYLHAMSPAARRRVAELLCAENTLDGESRRAFLQLIGDASADVREVAVKSMIQRSITSADLAELEPLLQRKASDLRRAVLGLVLTLNDDEVLTSAKRLMAAKSEQQRLAGLDLLQQMREKGRAADRVQKLAQDYQAARPKLVSDEQNYLEHLLAAEQTRYSLDDALGLMNPARRTPPHKPVAQSVKLSTPAALKLIELFDKEILRRCDEPVTLKRLTGDSEQQPLGSITYAFPQAMHGHGNPYGNPELRPIEELPFASSWIELFDSRPEKARDLDGLEWARAMVVAQLSAARTQANDSAWQAKAMESLMGGKAKIGFPVIVEKILCWIGAYRPATSLANFVVEAFEHLLAQIPADALKIKTHWGQMEFRSFYDQFYVLSSELRSLAIIQGGWKPEHTRRFYELQRWGDEPVVNETSSSKGIANTLTRAIGRLISKPNPTKESESNNELIPRRRLESREMLATFDAGVATADDLIDSLLGPRPSERQWQAGFDMLALTSSDLRRGKLTPAARAIVQRAVDRILQVELARGEAETPASAAALSLHYSGGLDVLVRVLRVFGRDPKLARQRTWAWTGSGRSKPAVLSHLARVTMPLPGDTVEQFTQAMAEAGISENTLLSIAFYAPQWARFVEAAVGWPMLAETIWWFHAHTKDSKWQVESDTRDAWNAEIRKLTPLTLEDLIEGAVDVDWFQRVYAAVGPERWSRLDDFAKYASGGGGHKRAQLFADAMLGRVESTSLLTDIESKRKQDAVRALGLVPLKNGDKPEVLKRYKIMQEFVRTCRQFGSQRQASEKLAARIGQENLARTAGFPDPIRLQWAMEGLATADLARGPVVVTVGDISVQLAFDDSGHPDITVRRGTKALKSIPTAAKKAAAVVELVERKTDLRRSASRMRESLELAMCRGDRFSGDELLELMGNVILRPMLERLVFIGEGILGYPIDGGQGLRGESGRVEPVRKSEVMRIAHPIDFLATKNWSSWQRDCFSAERVQPFKQVFRELYVLTGQDRKDATFTRRYAGHQVNPRQALALLGSRGWVNAPDSGIFRSFHEEKIVAWIEFLETFHTPADIEGLTIENVRFARRGAHESMILAEVPPRLLSEVLRDVDLIVSVAHRGGVDPEASASTVELRSALLRETLSLLKLDNVSIKEPQVHIQGKHARYSVHLGSATTHMLPGGSLFIVPVHSQHRGRIFLPFADDDPKSAEVMSKVLLLARDEEIKDPNILDQIRTAV